MQRRGGDFMGIIKTILGNFKKPTPKVEDVTKECDLIINKYRRHQRITNTKGAFGKPPKFRRDADA